MLKKDKIFSFKWKNKLGNKSLWSLKKIVLKLKDKLGKKITYLI